MKIYLASSWRNVYQPHFVTLLLDAGHKVYDFRNPSPGKSGFAWRETHHVPHEQWTVEEYLQALQTERAAEGFSFDFEALKWCDVCVLLLPCGKSAHLELGFAAGAGKHSIVMITEYSDAELMYLLCSAIVTSEYALLKTLAEIEHDKAK